MNLAELDLDYMSIENTDKHESPFHGKDGTPHTCPVCHSQELTTRITDTMEFGGENITTEVCHSCTKCGSYIAYWAYGFFDPWFAANTLSIWWDNKGHFLYNRQR